jgi:uncharacterized membrane protein YidH (DUF202 family)
MTDTNTAETATGTSDRMIRFTAEVADMKLKTGRTRPEHVLQVVGVMLMVGGIVLALGAYAASLDVAATPGSNVDVLNSSSYETLALVGVATSVVGGFVFLRYSLAQFLRFWLLRQSYDQQRAVVAAARPD